MFYLKLLSKDHKLSLVITEGLSDEFVARRSAFKLRKDGNVTFMEKLSKVHFFKATERVLWNFKLIFCGKKVKKILRKFVEESFPF